MVGLEVFEFFADATILTMGTYLITEALGFREEIRLGIMMLVAIAILGLLGSLIYILIMNGLS